MNHIAGRRQIEVRFIKQTPLDVCLDIWLRWHDRNDTSMGWRGRSVSLESDGAADSQQLYDRMDNAVAEAVDVMIGDLKVQHNWAIKRRCNLATIWKFPSLIFQDVLIEAENQLTIKLKNNLATHIYFV